MIPRPENPLIVALDVSDLEEAERLAAALAPHVGMLKVGLELFWAHGPEAVRRIASHGPVFVDCEAARHPEHGRAGRARTSRGSGVDDAERPRPRGRGDDARGARGGGPRRRADAGRPMPLVIAVTVLSSHVGRGSRVARRRSRSRRRRPGSTASSCRARTSRDVRDGVRRRVLPRRAGHPSGRLERRRSGAGADARRGDRARAPTTSWSVGRSPGAPIRSASRAASCSTSAERRPETENRRSARGRSRLSALRRAVRILPGVHDLDHPSRRSTCMALPHADPGAAQRGPREGRRRAQEARRAEGRAEVRQADAGGRAGGGRRTTPSAR